MMRGCLICALPLRNEGATTFSCASNLRQYLALSRITRYLYTVQPDTMPPALDSPSRAVRVPCEACNGTGKRASEWDLRTSAVVAYGPCTTCLCQGWLMVTPPMLRAVASV